MQVIYRTTATLRSWSQLQRVGHRDLFMEVCTRLEDMAKTFYPNMDGSIICGSALHHLRCFYNFSF